MATYTASNKDKQLKGITETFSYIARAINGDMGCFGYRIVTEMAFQKGSKLRIQYAGGNVDHPSITCLETQVSESNQVLIVAPKIGFRLAGVELSFMRRNFPIVMGRNQKEFSKHEETLILEYAEKMLARYKKKAARKPIITRTAAYIRQKLLFGE
ncbi:MAG: hypothetical protein AB7S81_09045 [Bdellovibrionales bacterium]